MDRVTQSALIITPTSFFDAILRSPKLAILVSNEVEPTLIPLNKQLQGQYFISKPFEDLTVHICENDSEWKYVMACTFNLEQKSWHFETFERNEGYLAVKMGAIQINNTPWIPDSDIVLSGNLTTVMDKFLGLAGKAQAEELVQEDQISVAIRDYAQFVWILKLGLGSELEKPLIHYIIQLILCEVGLDRVVLKTVH